MPTDCRRCDGNGYVTLGEDRFAIARLCECSNPCPDCRGDRRQITRGPDGRTTVVPCACVAVHRRILRFNEARIPAYFHGKTVEKYAAKSTEEQAVKRWMLSFQATANDRSPLVLHSLLTPSAMAIGATLAAVKRRPRCVGLVSPLFAFKHFLGTDSKFACVPPGERARR